MKSPVPVRVFLPSLLVLLAACGESGAKTASVVQAATKGAAEVGQQLAEKAAELAHMTPEEAKGKMQEFLDAAARELREVRDSETVQRIAQDLQPVLDRFTAVKKSVLPKLNLASIQQAILDLIEKFKNDPRVVSTLKALHEKLQSLSH